MKKILILAIILSQLVCNAFADESEPFNPDDNYGEIVTLSTKNFIKTTILENYDSYFLIDKDTKIIYHSKIKKIIAGSIIKYDTSYRDSSPYLTADIIHVYDFNIDLLN
jgi:hypothetical protein